MCVVAQLVGVTVYTTSIAVTHMGDATQNTSCVARHGWPAVTPFHVSLLVRTSNVVHLCHQVAYKINMAEGLWHTRAATLKSCRSLPCNAQCCRGDNL